MSDSAIHAKTRQTDPAAEMTAQQVSSVSVLELVLLRVRLRARRRAMWLAHLGGGATAAAQSELDPNLAACLDDRDWPESEGAWYRWAEAVQPLNDELARVERAL